MIELKSTAIKISLKSSSVRIVEILYPSAAPELSTFSNPSRGFTSSPKSLEIASALYSTPSETGSSSTPYKIAGVVLS